MWWIRREFGTFSEFQGRALHGADPADRGEVNGGRWTVSGELSAFVGMGGCDAGFWEIALGDRVGACAESEERFCWRRALGLPLGRLPGDISYKGKNVSFYFPLGTSIVISVVLSVVLYLLSRFRR